MKKWLIVVLSVAWLVWELISANDSDPHTWPLTHILAEHVPSWVVIPAAAALSAWLVPHFVSAYKRREAAVDTTQPAPLPSSADASNRAFRTFIQGLGLDVATAVVLVLATSVTDMRWTKEYWFTLLALLGKTAILSAVAYAARKLMPPPSGPAKQPQMHVVKMAGGIGYGPTPEAARDAAQTAHEATVKDIERLARRQPEA